MRMAERSAESGRTREARRKRESQDQETTYLSGPGRVEVVGIVKEGVKSAI